jgi:hypothetical protein
VLGWWICVGGFCSLLVAISLFPYTTREQHLTGRYSFYTHTHYTTQISTPSTKTNNTNHALCLSPSALVLCRLRPCGTGRSV